MRPRPTWIRRPGDIVLRRAILTPVRVLLPRRVLRRPALPLGVWLAAGFGGLVILGTVLLLTPLANTTGRLTPLADALFTATSAVCVTGLTVVDTATYWSPFGKAVLLALIQIGGLGFMTTSTLLLLAIGRRITLRERMRLSQSQGEQPLGASLGLARRVILFTVVIEAFGALLLTLRWVQGQPWPTALWQGVFHSVSAFNNAGFSVFSNSLESFARDPVVLLTIAAIVMLGGIGFTFLADVVAVRRFSRLTLDSKIVLVSSIILWLAGTAVVLLLEYANIATLGNLDVPSRVLNAFFVSVTARTVGFDSLNVGLFRDYTLLFITFLMFVGAASGSTGGGIKLNTFSLLVVAAWAALRGRFRVEIFGREVPEPQVRRALAITMMSAVFVFLVVLLLTVTEKLNALSLLFEGVSAFGTVGLSTGITPGLSVLGQLIIVFTMFVGRLGPLVLALTLVERAQKTDFRFPEEPIKLG